MSFLLHEDGGSRGISIKQCVIGVFVLATGLPSVLALSSFYYFDKEYSARQMQTQITHLMDSVESGIGYALYSGNSVALQLAVEPLTKNNYVREVSILNRFGNFVFGEPHDIPNSSGSPVIRRDLSISINQSKTPALLNVGTLIIEIDEKLATADANFRRRVAFSILLLQIFAVTVVSFIVFNRIISNPLKKLAQEISNLEPESIEAGKARLAWPSVGWEIKAIVGKVNLLFDLIHKRHNEVNNIRNMAISSFESLERGIIMFEEDGSKAFSNRPFEGLFDMLSENGTFVDDDVTNSQDLVRYLADARDGSKHELRELLECLNTLSGSVDAEISLKGSRYISISFTEVPQGGAILILSDVSENRSLTNQIHHVDKMQVLGKLAAGYAHDFNNFLGVISGQLELLRHDKGSAETMLEYLDNADAAILNASARSKGLLDYVSEKGAVEYFTAQKIAKQIEHSVAHFMTDRVEISFKVTSDCVIAVDPRMLISSVVNLIVNAYDAIIGVGKIEVSIGQKIGSGNNDATISVKDSGTGIPPDFVNSIFDPFATTKASDKGTGLGLNIVKQFIESAGGQIRLLETSSSGTTFELEVPTCESAVAETAKTKKQEVPRMRSRVLLVEDEIMLGRTMKKVLEIRGLSVSWFESCIDASAEIRDAIDSYDVVVTDMLLRDGNGLDVARLVRKLAPKMPIIVTSGNVPIEFMAGLEEVGVFKTVQKPAQSIELYEVICLAHNSTLGNTFDRLEN